MSATVRDACDDPFELSSGDIAVHRAHGIARFHGVSTLDHRGCREDFIELEFAGGARRWAPATDVALVRRWSSGAARAPRLSAIDSRAWRRRVVEAGDAATGFARELIERQAARIARGGIAFPDPGDALARFAATFAHELTDGQRAAIDAVLADMRRPTPMERLVCGDVGFGKTEVAARAAFVAVHAGYQVAVLAPTTLLAEQHVATLRARFAERADAIDALDRVRSDAERAELKRRAADGSIAILVGTHALLADDVRFARLGLVIVDEEHRFGVEQKERLKQLGAGADLLALSATPLPRTLRGALGGLVELSTLDAAPDARLAIATEVGPWDDARVAEAIARERARGGQVIAVTHRIGALGRLSARLRRLSPGLRIAIAHGAMPEDEVEAAMLAFARGDADALVATAIVESGLDLPNANTLIVDDAQRFGLTALHQLRGRVGRGATQAYALLLVPADAAPSDAARERLAALADASDLGAGWRLALRDLELRGAGDLLGARQSGHIDAVGLGLYLDLLDEAVRAQRGRPTNAPAATAAVDLRVDAFVPIEWSAAVGCAPIAVHRRLAACRTTADVDALAAIWPDAPAPVARLLALARLRVAAAAAGIATIARVDAGARCSPASPGLCEVATARGGSIDRDAVIIPGGGDALIAALADLVAHAPAGGVAIAPPRRRRRVA